MGWIAEFLAIRRRNSVTIGIEDFVVLRVPLRIDFTHFGVLTGTSPDRRRLMSRNYASVEHHTLCLRQHWMAR